MEANSVSGITPRVVVPGGWNTKEVALAQYKTVLSELEHPERVGPFIAFRWAMDAIGLKAGRLLDIGCGVGHYGVLCERYYPGIQYTGTDISSYAIEIARGFAPLGSFRVMGFADNDFGKYDILLVSQTMEMMHDPPAALDLLLEKARRFIILNRLRLTRELSRQFTEITYCGYSGREWEWNEAELLGTIERAGFDVIERLAWENQATLTLRKRGQDDKPTKLCGCSCCTCSA